MALRSFREGDRVKALILAVDTEKRRISLGLKPSYFSEDDFQGEPDEAEVEDSQAQSLGVVEDDDDAMSGTEDAERVEDNQNVASSDEEDAMVVDESPVDQSIFGSSGPSQHVPAPSATRALKLDSGFKWSADQDAEQDAVSESSSDEDEDEEQTSKKKKRRRKEIEQDLTADLHTKAPESNADFERLLLGSPNSSYLWVQYMSFQLQLSEIEKAREIAKRALKTINFREEQEKLNVWIALLNLENIYGTDESLEATFKDAARHNDSKTIHLRLAAILNQSEKYEVRVIADLRYDRDSECVRYRKQKSSINGHARSSDRAPRSGHYLANTISHVERWRKLVSYSLVVCKVLRSTNVSVVAAALSEYSLLMYHSVQI